MASITIPEDQAFVAAWRALDARDRRRLRRLVRVGRPVTDRDDAAVAVAYARYQRSRPWWRLFWLWFVPGLIVAIGVAVTIHPLVIGVVLGFAAQALLVRRNTQRAEHVNEAALLL